MWRGVAGDCAFRNEKLIGVVTRVAAKAPADVEIRPLEAVLDEEPLLSEQLLELAEWMAQYYLAPLGEVLRGMLPLTAEVRRTVYYRITDLGRDVLANGWRVRLLLNPTLPAKNAGRMGHPAFHFRKESVEESFRPKRWILRCAY